MHRHAEPTTNDVPKDARLTYLRGEHQPLIAGNADVSLLDWPQS